MFMVVKTHWLRYQQFEKVAQQFCMFNNIFSSACIEI